MKYNLHVLNTLHLYPTTFLIILLLYINYTTNIIFFLQFWILNLSLNFDFFELLKFLSFFVIELKFCLSLNEFCLTLNEFLFYYWIFVWILKIWSFLQLKIVILIFETWSTNVWDTSDYSGRGVKIREQLCQVKWNN